ncbi:MAG: glyoxalase/bleomycin resistance protein/dioxygenase [Phenylobacterium sp.]|nr:glyoxalase/bleomycin resistance protein/dioxygenase [Phenylobacterium sp.]
MITGLDHVAIAVRDFGAAVDAYRRLLGREPDLEPGGGAQRAWFRFSNMALEIIAPDGAGAAGDRLRAQLEANGEGLWLMAFAVDDLPAAARLLTRRGLAVEVLADRPIARSEAAGLRLILLEPDAAPPSPTTGEGAVAALDHVVVRTPNADRAVANFGGRLGLDLRLDRSNESWGARQLFFKAGDAVVEFGASLKAPVTDEPDTFGGLAWRVADPHAAQARMTAGGFDVSEVRTGRKPGTHVFTVRSGAPGLPALFIEQGGTS